MMNCHRQNVKENTALVIIQLNWIQQKMHSAAGDLGATTQQFQPSE